MKALNIIHAPQFILSKPVKFADNFRVNDTALLCFTKNGDLAETQPLNMKTGSKGLVVASFEQYRFGYLENVN